MDMQAKKDSADGAGMRGEVARDFAKRPRDIEAMVCSGRVSKNGEFRHERFTEELARCAEARFRGEKPGVEELNAYVGALRLKDLGLACACADGVAEAWEHFVGIYRGYLRACAGGNAQE